MKLINRTTYNGKDLRKFILAGMKAEGVDPKGYVVEIVYQPRRSSCSGYGQYYRPWVKLQLPKDGMTPERVKMYAQVLVHEFGHNQGLRHKDMPWSSQIEVPWAEGLVIRENAPKPKPEGSLLERRAAHARKMLEKHEAKLKREQTLVRKWRRKVRYYDKAFQRKAAASK